jgi:hypothetical protein
MVRLRMLTLLLICQLAAIIAPVRAIGALVVGNTAQAWEIIKAYDRLGNAAGNGNSHETISSRAERGTLEGKRGWCLLCRLLDRIKPNHCRDSAGV